MLSIFFFQSCYLREKRPLSVPNFTSVISKMNSPPSLSSSNYISHSAWISWSLHGCMHVSFLLHLTTLSRLSRRRSYFASSCTCFCSFAFMHVFVCLPSLCGCLCINMHAPAWWHATVLRCVNSQSDSKSLYF